MGFLRHVQAFGSEDFDDELSRIAQARRDGEFAEPLTHGILYYS